MLSTLDPHVVNPPTSPQGLIDPDEAVRAFLEELGDIVPTCQIGFNGTRCTRAAAWVQHLSCGCQNLACGPCKAVVSKLTESRKVQCAIHEELVTHTWRKL